jgi:hypothetical protein
MALHAFPRRFRAARSAEIVATFEEAELAGDVHPYGIQALADVVVAGWAERWRTHPPLGTYLKYRLLDGRLPARWHRWMLDDVHGWFGLRRVAWASWAIVAVLLVLQQAGMAALDRGFVLVFIGMVVPSLVLTPRYRRAILCRHGYDPDTLAWVPPGHWTPALPRPPRMVRVAPVAFTMAAALATVAPFAVLASLGHIGTGSGSVTRQADGQVPATIGAVTVAALIATAGILGRRSISMRFTRTVPADAPVYFVYSDIPSAGTLSAADAVLGLIVCFAPVTPLIVPLTILVTAGAVPTLVLTGIDVQRGRPDGEITVWTPRPSNADTATTP